MPSVLRRVSLAEEHMPQMSTAIPAGDFCAIAVFIEVSFHCTFNLVIETGPAAMAAEFVFREVQRRVALTTDVRARILHVGVLTDIRTFRTLLLNHVRFELTERVVLRRYNLCRISVSHSRVSL